MIRWSTCSSSNHSTAWRAAAMAGGVAALLFGAAARAAAVEREPMTLRVVTVNPSAEKSKTVPIRIDLPQEIRPGDIVDAGDLQVEFDTERSQYFVFKDEVELAPKQTRVFQVVVKDVWFIPETELESLKAHASLVLKRLERSEYAEAGKQLANSILSRLDGILTLQADESVSRKARIGDYRRNLESLKSIKEDLARMEKLLSFTGGTPVPEMMDESPLKMDAPSTTTTWLVIFLIMIFMGLLAGQFFFTWQRRVKASGEFGSMGDAGMPSQPAGAPGGPRESGPARSGSPGA